MVERVVIALFRHGITEANKQKAYLGWNDSPLCEDSLNYFTNKEYDSYYSSDLQRCMETASRLFPSSNPILLDYFREMNFGEWEGKTFDELKNDLLYQKWLMNPFLYFPPGGESFSQFSKRVKFGWRKMVNEILTNQVPSCALITHGGVIRFLLCAFAPEEKEFWDWHVGHDQGFELIFDKKSLRRDERCISLQEVPLTGNDLG